MRAAILALLSLFFGFSWVGAQTTPPATPEDQVAALIREALQTPDDRGAWAGLAQGLSELDATEGGDPARLDDAVRVADSLAFSAELTPESNRAEELVSHPLMVSIKGWAKGLFASVSQWRPPENIGYTGSLLWPALLLLTLTGFLLLRRVRVQDGSGWAFLRLIRTVSRVARGSTAPPPTVVRNKNHRGRKNPKFLALSLVETGMPTNEVARRTGMSQDEVSVLLTIHRSKRVPFGLDVPTPSRRSA